MPFSIERNDLASMHVDAIVVAANENLQITGGVGLAVAQVAGLERVQSACDEIGFCPTGSAIVTPGFDLHARTIVHAVGPIWREGGRRERRLLASAYTQALQRAADADAQSVALPLLSAGTYGCPAEVSFSLAMEAVRAFLEQHDMDVRVVLYSRAAVSAGLSLYGDIASYIDDRYVDEHASYARESVGFGREGDWRFPDRLPGDSGHYAQPPQVPQRDSGHYAQSPQLPQRASGHYAQPPQRSSGHYAQAPQPTRRDSSAQSDDQRRGFFKRLRERRKEERRIIAAAPSDGAPEPLAAPSRTEEFDAFEASACEPMADVPMGAAPMAAAPMAAPSLGPDSAASLDDLLNALDEPFSTTLLALIDARGMTDAQVYKRANMSRQLFSKIRSDASYRPTKKTILALSVALELSLDETGDLLRRAGFALSRSNKADIIVEYFIKRGVYDIFTINEALYSFDQPLL